MSPLWLQQVGGADRRSHAAYGLTVLPAGGWRYRATASRSKHAELLVSFTVNAGVRIMKTHKKHLPKAI